MVCIANVILHRQSLANALLMGLAGLLTVLAAEFVSAEESAAESVPGTGPCAAGAYRDFDFWLGKWRVHLADGTFAGENRIEASPDGCLITERWQGARGSLGYSINFYEPAAARWRQVWVSTGSIIEISGGFDGDSMVLEGEIRYRVAPGAEPGAAEVDAAGPVRAFRGRWTLLPDGRVRQFFEELIPVKTDAGGDAEKWQPWFEGFYAKAVE